MVLLAIVLILIIRVIQCPGVFFVLLFFFAGAMEFTQAAKKYVGRRDSPSADTHSMVSSNHELSCDHPLHGLSSVKL